MAIKKPRVVGRQTCPNNVAADSPEEYYRRAMAIPLLDHVISDRNQIISKINNLLSLNIIGLDKQELKTLCTEIKEFLTKILQILLKKNSIFGKKNGRMLKMRKGPKIQLKI